MNALLAVLLLAPQASDESRAVYEKAADSVVGIRAMATLGERSGSGVIVSKDGFIITSFATCPPRSEDIRVYLRGPRLLTAKLVAASESLELSLIKVEPKGELTPIEFGDAASVKLGDVSYTLGNASNSIINNDSASFAAGIISGRYTIRQAHGRSIYVGPVLETTAAVNVGMEGSPLLDAKGRMIGFITLNFSPSRFLGNAIPAEAIRAAVESLKKETTVAQSPEPGDPVPGYLGIAVADRNGKVVVESVDPGSPAERVGLGRGQVLLALGGRPVKSAAEFQASLKELKSGDILFLKIHDDGEVEVKVTLGRKDSK